MSVPGFATPQQVVLQQVRGRFDGGVTKSTGKYHAAFVNDAWQMGKHVTLNLGVRWEQQRITGNVVGKVFNDMWSPRIGFTVDPKGDRKSKFYANYGRYAFILPLDAALRSLSNEDDIQNPYWAPQSDASGKVALNSLGTVNFIPDSAHLLNNATGGVPIAGGDLVSGGEPFAPGTRMEYTDEFLVGYDHEFRGGIVASVRYIDRRLKRVIEDQGGISVEQFNALLNGGHASGLNYVIGNPNAKQDIFVNPNEVVFGAVSDPTALQQAISANNLNPSAAGAGSLVDLGTSAPLLSTQNYLEPHS